MDGIVYVYWPARKNGLSTSQIVIDIKNFALYTGGIAGYFRPLLLAWVAARPGVRFTLVGPPCDVGKLATMSNCSHHFVAWPASLPRVFRHPWYDNILFPRAIRKIKPDFVFSPYHDVRLPRGVPSAMMIHDTCIGDLPGIYPWRVRAYYQHMLRVNAARARHVLTVSENSRACILEKLKIDCERISVVPNALEAEFLAKAENDAGRAMEIRGRTAGMRLFYPGGAEFRKNVRRLIEALCILGSQGLDPVLWTTGERDAGWDRALDGIPSPLAERIQFVGRLSVPELRVHYLAADAVVYPSLCEGFGRVCLEAMVLGVPIACSNLSALREVAGQYPIYFNPLDVSDMARAIAAAAQLGRRKAISDPRFDSKTVAERFVKTMDAVLAKELAHA